MDIQEGEAVTEFFEWRDAPRAQYAVIGDPVSHSLSPKIQNAAFQALGINAEYVAIRVPFNEFNEALEHIEKLGYKGLNVTVPLKELALKWVKDISEEDRLLGAINTLSFDGKKGINTDVLGMRDVLDGLLTHEKKPNVLILGAGGTARAIAIYLSQRGCKVNAWNRTQSRLESFISELTADIEIRCDADPTGCDVIINATSSSMQNESLPVLWLNAHSTGFAIDCYYTQGKTLFQLEAESAGLKSVDGRCLLVAQGAQSFVWWTGVPSPVNVMIDAVNED